jgi:hypothetical protein
MRFWGGIFLLGAGLNVLLGWHGWPAVFAGRLSDPDSYMRLERILQGVHQGHLVNVVARDQSGAGVLVEWSRLLDIVLWALAAPFAVIVGWRNALFAAGIVIGPVGVGFLGVALAFAVRFLAEDGLLWSAAVAAALLPGLLDFALPGVVHYHILLLALTALAAGCMVRAWRGSVGIGFCGGLAGGFAIWLTPETMPFILMAFLPLLVRWWRRPIGAVLTATAAGFVDVIGFGFIVDPPQGGYFSPEIDRISIVYFLLGVFLLLGASLCWRLQRWNNRWRAPAGTAILAALLLGWIALFPQVVEGPYGIMAAADAQKFFALMLELQPLHGAQLPRYLTPGVLALLYTLWRAASPRFSWVWAYLAWCLLVALVLADRFILFTGFATAAAAAFLPVALSDAGSRLRASPNRAMAARLAIIAALFLLPVLPGLVHPPPAEAGPAFPSCDLRQIGSLLGRDKNTVVLAEAQETPELLYRTPVETVGSLYQHGLPGYLKARAAWRSPPGATEPAAVAATGAKLILFCRRPTRYPPVADIAGTSLWDALEAGQPPAWLTLTAEDPATGWQVFEIH